MKKLFAIKTLVLVMFLNINVKAQDRNTFAFTYDAAGNVIQRQLQIMPPLPEGRVGNFKKDTTEIAPPLNFKIYPNPTNQYVNIEGDLPEAIEEAQIFLLNTEGKILKTEMYKGQAKTMDVSDLKNGMYMLEVNYSKNKRSTYKIIVSK